jgi:hypothetical protein
MNTIISLNVNISTKNVNNHCQIIFINRCNIIKFSELMSSKRKPILKKLCYFIRAINTGVCPPGF